MKYFLVVFFLSLPTMAGVPSSTTREWTSAKFAASGSEFRKIRRVGIGANVGGNLGIAGLTLDLNFTPQTSFALGYGIGDPFNTFALTVKRFFGGEKILPYFAAGYARWFRDKPGDQRIENTTPSFLLNRFLNDDEKQTGRFHKNFLTPSIGVQYATLSGDWAGMVISAELDLFIDIENLVTATTGGLGLSYYF